MITIIDYGLGNLSSIKNMLRRLGFSSEISSDPDIIAKAEKLILPGVGAFDHGMKSIAEKGLREVLNKKTMVEKVPTLGICLGMQLLFEGSEEGIEPGLGCIRGKVVKFNFGNGLASLKIPHMGWNTVKIKKESILVNNFLTEMCFYFVHSYHVICEKPDDVLLSTDYGGEVTASVQHGNIMGTQFHPEKSHKYGMILMKNFAEL